MTAHAAPRLHPHIARRLFPHVLRFSLPQISRLNFNPMSVVIYTCVWGVPAQPALFPKLIQKIHYSREQILDSDDVRRPVSRFAVVLGLREESNVRWFKGSYGYICVLRTQRSITSASVSTLRRFGVGFVRTHHCIVPVDAVATLIASDVPF